MEEGLCGLCCEDVSSESTASKNPAQRSCSTINAEQVVKTMLIYLAQGHIMVL